MATSSTDLNSLARSFFGVLGRGRSYLNGLYLLLAFPLGVLYFTFLTVGVSLGLGLLLIWIGLAVLAAVLLVSWLLSSFERLQAIWLLGAPIEGPAEAPAPASAGERIKRWLSDRVTWTGPLFLLLKFPLGVVSFCVAIFCIAASMTLLLAPVFFPWEHIHFDFGGWQIAVDTWFEALLCTPVGLLFLILSLHVFDGLAWVWRGLARYLLGHAPLPRLGGSPAAA